MDECDVDGAPEMIKCVTKIKNKTNKNNKQNGKRKIKTKISFVSSILVEGRNQLAPKTRSGEEKKELCGADNFDIVFDSRFFHCFNETRKKNNCSDW